MRPRGYGIHMLTVLLTLFVAAQAIAGVKESVQRLDSISKIRPASEDVNVKLLSALDIIDKMAEGKKWVEIRKLIDIAEFQTSRYYDDLLYIYLAHAGNQQDYRTLSALGERIAANKDSIHYLAAMLIRLHAQRKFASNKNGRFIGELSLLLDHIETAPDRTIVHGPVFEGNAVFGYKIKEDYSKGILPRLYLLKDYSASPEPLDGFSDDTQYTALLELYKQLNMNTIAMNYSRVEKLAALYAASRRPEKVAAEYYFLADHALNDKDPEKARVFIHKAMQYHPGNKAHHELNKEIELALILAKKKQDDTFSRVFRGSIDEKYSIEMNLKCDDSRLEGTYSYDVTGKPLRLEGTIDTQGNFSLREFDEQGSQTGSMKGSFVSNSEIKGTWSNPDGERTLPFSARTTNPRVP